MMSLVLVIATAACDPGATTEVTSGVTVVPARSSAPSLRAQARIVAPAVMVTDGTAEQQDVVDLAGAEGYPPLPADALELATDTTPGDGTGT